MQTGFFGTLWNNLREAFGERVELGTNAVTTLNIVVWALFLGFIIAIAITLYNKFVVGKVVRALISREIHTKECAITLSDAGCDNIFLRLALRRGGAFRRIVRAAGDTDTERDKTKPEDAKFYIPHEFIARAESIYGTKGTNPVTIVLSILAILAVTIAMFFLIPNVIEMISGFVEGIAPTDSNVL